MPAAMPVEEPPEAVSPPASPPTVASALTLDQVERSWPQVLHAVRTRNPATQAVLNTGCQPVEVIGEEVVVTFPFPFLKDKLGDPQRRAEIQEALSEVLGMNCLLKLVLASEFTPRMQASPASPVPTPTTTPPTTPAAPPVEATDSAETTSGGSGTGAQAGDEELPEAVSRWAKPLGGQVKIVPE
jgi:hypothetical protein